MVVKATQAHAQAVDWSKFEGKPLTNAVKKLKRLNGIAFSYSSGSLDEVVVPTLPDSLSGVLEFLQVTLSNSTLEVERIGSTYVIYAPVPADQNTPTRTDFAISGQVRDADTGETLPYAAVGVAGTAFATTTNSDGKFTLLMIPADTVLLVVRYLGYKTLNYRMNAQTPLSRLELEMDRQGRDLPSVVVTAAREPMLEMGKRVGQLAFNPMEIHALPGLGENDLFSSLRLLPGVGNSESSSGLQIRGSATDENLVLFDGITVYHVDHFFGYLSAFNSNMVKNVQVSKGGFGARYGGRAGGVLDITGIDGNKKQLTLTSETGALSSSLLAELPLVEDKASLVLSYRRGYMDILRTAAYRNMFNVLFNASVPNAGATDVDVFGTESVPDFGFFDFNAKVHFKPTAKDNVALSFYRGADDLTIGFGTEGEGIVRVSSDETRWGNTGGSIKWSRKWSAPLFTYANFGISRYNSDLNAEVLFLNDDDELLTRRFLRQGVILDDATFRLDNTYDIGPNSRLGFGFWNSNYSINMQAQDQDFVFVDSLQNASLAAGYLDFEFNFGSFTAKSGLRTSLYELQEAAILEPRLSLAYELGYGINLKAAAGRYTQAIRRLNERSLYRSIPETWVLAGATEVPLLTSDQYIVGVQAEYMGWQFDLEAYHKYDRGIVDFLFPEFGLPTGSLDQYAVDGIRSIIGVDFLLKKRWNRQYLMASYTYIDAQSRYYEVENGSFFPSSGIAAHEANVLYRFQYKRWDFSSTIVVSSGLPYTPVLGTFVITLENGEQQQFVSLGDVNSQLTPWQHRIDVGANYTLPLSKAALTFGLSVFNVYNRNNVRFVDYFAVPVEQAELFAISRRDVVGLGITPTIFIRLKI